MDITLIRHTKVAIQEGICYGQSDVELASTFETEAKEILNKIRNKEFDMVYSSPLNRCKYLAKELFPNKEIIYDNRLMELDFGNWEGKHWDDISKTNEAQAFFNDYVNTACPNGESFQDLINRITGFYTEIKSKHPLKWIAIVCHSGPIRAFMCVIEKISPHQAFDRKLDFGEVYH